MFHNVELNEYNNNYDGNDIFSSPLQFQIYDSYNYNQFNSLYGDEKLNNYSQIPSNDPLKSEKGKIIISKCTKTTASKTTLNYGNYGKYNEPELYTSSKILEIFNKESNQNKISEYLKKLNFGEFIEGDLQLTNKKTMRENFDELNIFNQIDNYKTKAKRGRKTNKTNRLKIHDKNISDNIMKKIKSSIINNYILFFLNNIIKKTYDSYNLNDIKLLKLDYKSVIDTLKKERELEFINLPLKDIFSNNISSKYQKFNDYNKIIIENILKNCKVNENQINQINENKNKIDENKTDKNKEDEDKDKDAKTLLFAFNLTLRDWLDIFTLKKTVKDIINEKSIEDDEKINIEKIESSFVGIDELLTKIKEKNDVDYLTHFIIYLYNYERWFYLKVPKNCSKNEKEM